MPGTGPPPPVPRHRVAVVGPSSSSSSSSSTHQQRQQNGAVHRLHQARVLETTGPNNGFSNVSRSTTFVYSPSALAARQNVAIVSPDEEGSQSSNTGGFISPPPPHPPMVVEPSSGASSSAASSATFSPNSAQQDSRFNSLQRAQQQQYMETAETECLEHYESNLEKYKDERDAIQKKTFTKWVNQHLMKSDKKVDDLFLDLRDGNNLIDLLQALSAEHLLREHGFTRFHRIQNVQCCLEFLRRKNIKLVNIRPEDIVEGNGKLTLGLIWTIILNFQVSAVIAQQHQQQADMRTSATTAAQSRTRMLQQTAVSVGGGTTQHSVQRTVGIYY